MAKSKRKYNKPTETVPVKDLMGGFTRQNFKMFLKMLKELKEDVEKVKKMMYKQNENINKEII